MIFQSEPSASWMAQAPPLCLSGLSVQGQSSTCCRTEETSVSSHLPHKVKGVHKVKCSWNTKERDSSGAEGTSAITQQNVLSPESKRWAPIPSCPGVWAEDELLWASPQPMAAHSRGTPLPSCKKSWALNSVRVCFPDDLGWHVARPASENLS